MRGDRGEQQREDLPRLRPGPCFDRAGGQGLAQRVAQLHELGHGRVPPEPLHVVADLGDGLVGTTAQIGGGRVVDLRLFVGGGAQLPGVDDEAVGAFDAPAVPGPALLPLEGEHQVGPHRVGAVLVDQLVRVDRVAARLGHAFDLEPVTQLAHIVGPRDGGNLHGGTLGNLDRDRLGGATHP